MSVHYLALEIRRENRDAREKRDDEASRRQQRLLIIQLIEQKRGEIFDLETEYDMLGGGCR